MAKNRHFLLHIKKDAQSAPFTHKLSIYTTPEECIKSLEEHLDRHNRIG